MCALSGEENPRQKGEKMSASNKAVGVKRFRLLDVCEHVCQGVTTHTRETVLIGHIVSVCLCVCTLTTF